MAHRLSNRFSWPLNMNGKQKQYSRNHYIRNREKLMERSRIYRKNNPEASRRWSAKYRNNNREKIRAYSIKKSLIPGYVWASDLRTKYGITTEEYDGMFNNQNGVCAICGNPQSLRYSKNGRLCVDHCHSTKKIRGLLCRPCNLILGLCKDNAVVLKSAIEYLGADKFEKFFATELVTK